MLLAPPFREVTRQRRGLAGDRKGQEAIVPTVAAGLEAARDALGPQGLERRCQQGLLLKTHGTSPW